MPRLFSYGSLQQPAVQLATFGRLLAGRRDALVGFELQTVLHDGKPLANVIPSQGMDARVSGTAFEVTETELAAADAYERGDDYRRLEVTLESGDASWVYVHGDRR